MRALLDRRRWMLVATLLVAVLAVAWLAPRLVRRYYHHGLTLVTVAQGLDTPWAMAFPPDGRMLVTERVGRLRIVERDGRLGAPLAGLPPVWAHGEGGLLNVTLDPHHADNHYVYWSYSEPAPGNDEAASTAVARGRLGADRLTEVQVTFRQPLKTTDSRHFGSRLLFGPDGRLFIGLGDRMLRDDAQRLDSAHGKVMHIEADGSVPADNPFVQTAGALPTIWSLGHRNVQGLVLNPQTGALWASEHGPQGGDEINLLRAGQNYGWPVVTHGCEYDTCAPIGEGFDKPGMVSPVTWWGPESVPPTAMTFLTSDRYPSWKGQLFVGALHSPSFTRIRLDGERVVEREALYAGVYRRIRDIKQGPDGWLYFVVNQPDGRIIRLER